jgi:hypothetical protein
MAHVLIMGMTLSGKTTLAKRLCHAYMAQGINCIVLDPINDPGWNTPYTFRDGTEFLDVCKASRQCAVFIDESGSAIGTHAHEMQWLATQARHWGHKSHFIMQRGQQLDKTMRDQCTHLYLFRVSKDDAKILANEFAQDELLQANELKQFEFFSTSKFGTPRREYLTASE